jgi:hypothetical protein
VKEKQRQKQLFSSRLVMALVMAENEQPMFWDFQDLIVAA